MAKKQKTESTDEAEDTREVVPTLEEARAMFGVRKDLDSVVTTDGLLYRDGRLEVLSA